MDQWRWMIIGIVTCLVVFTLVLLSRYSRPAHQVAESSLETVSDDDRDDHSSPVTQAGESVRHQSAESVSNIVVPPPPAFFSVPSTPEEDTRMTQELTARGKALKPDILVASAPGSVSRGSGAGK